MDNLQKGSAEFVNKLMDNLQKGSTGFVKKRTESKELRCLRILNVRMKLSNSVLNHFNTLDKGFQGELMFDKWSAGLQGDWLKLNDLLLEQSNNLFQIDSFFVTPSKNYLFEIKNFEGDFYVEGDKWYSTTGGEIKNPYHQLQRCETLLSRLLLSIGVNLPIESYLIFINPEFHLFQALMNLPIIYPTQLNRLLNKLNTTPPVFKNGHPKFVNKLLSLHLDESPFSQIPSYSFDNIGKGIICVKCKAAFYEFKDDKLACIKCQNIEDVTSGILRNVEEFEFLFPVRKITTSSIHEWCGVITSKKMIRRILLSNYKSIGDGRHRFFIK
jgi:hypothetical protein